MSTLIEKVDVVSYRRVGEIGEVYTFGKDGRKHLMANLNTMSSNAMDLSNIPDGVTLGGLKIAKGIYYKKNVMPPPSLTLENAESVSQVFDLMTVVVRNLPNLNLSKLTLQPDYLARGTAFNAATVRAIASTLPDKSGQTRWTLYMGVDATLQDDAAVQADLQLIRDKNYDLHLEYNA